MTSTDDDLDPHRVLGVSRNASEKEIKAAYRKLALLHHPDRVVSSKDDDPQQIRQANLKFAEISHAYESLMEQKHQQQSSSPSNNYDPSASSFRNHHHAYRDPFEIFESVFREEFGGGFPSRSSSRRHSQSRDPFADFFRSPFDDNDDFFAPFLGRGGGSSRRSNDPFGSFFGSGRSGFGFMDDDNDDDWMVHDRQRRNSRRQTNGQQEYPQEQQEESIWSRMHRMHQQLQQQQPFPFDNENGDDNIRDGNRKFFSTSTSTIRKSYRNEQGEMVETTETIRNVNGQEQVTKETITHKTDGTVERQLEQSGDPKVLEYFGDNNNKNNHNDRNKTEQSSQSSSPHRRLTNWFSLRNRNHDNSNHDDDATKKR